MLHTISWAWYISGILFILAVYYIYLLSKWYPDKFKKLLFFKGTQAAGENGPDEDNYAPEKKEGIYAPFKNLSIAEMLAVDSKRLIRRAAKENMPRATLLMALQAMIRADPWHLIREDSFRQTLNKIIRIEAETYCSIQLNDDELYGLWER